MGSEDHQPHQQRKNSCQSRLSPAKSGPVARFANIGTRYRAIGKQIRVGGFRANSI